MTRKRFIILFEEKEGSTPIIRLLDNFGPIDIVRHVSNKGWEPFDYHSCGAISLRDYRQCLDIICGSNAPDIAKLNTIYTKTARGSLAPFDAEKTVGFKMRFRPQDNITFRRWLRTPGFIHATQKLFQKHSVVVFVMVRQDVFRWALSRYHGDGTGRPGHLQFKIAKGEIDRSALPRIKVEMSTFRRLLADCERRIERKRRLVKRLSRRGITTFPLFYERFCADPQAFFSQIMQYLDIPMSTVEIQAALEKGTNLQKVHSEDIHDFVLNADEVMTEAGERYVTW